MARMKKSGDSVKKGGGAVIVIAVLALVVVVVMGATIAYLLLSQSKTEAEAPEQEESAQRSVLVTPENVDEILEQQPEPETDADRYTVTMNTTWNFPDGASPSDNAYVENSTDNSHAVYFDVVRNDTGETIYGSPVLPVGQNIQKFKLDKQLEKGIYDCVVVYHLVDDAQNTLSTVNVALTINVGKVSLRDNAK